jgi:lipoate-protein ligase B
VGAAQVRVVRLGRTRYRECWNLQHALFARRAAGELTDVLLLTEHEHVYTLGTGADIHHLLATDGELRARGIDVVAVDRGGAITYHGPGQLVGYPLLDLHAYTQDLHWYLRRLEEVIIRVLEGFHVSGSRLDGYTGVWVGGEKICAIGIKASRWITMHGFALNVTTDLSFFDRIIPCGIFERGVTSLQELLGSAPPMGTVESAVAGAFAEVFGAALTEGVLTEQDYRRGSLQDTADRRV